MHFTAPRHKPARRRVDLLVAFLLFLCVISGGSAVTPAATPQVQHYDASHWVFEDFPLNITVFHWINSHHAPWLDKVCVFAHYVSGGWLLVVVVPAVYLLRRNKTGVLLMAVAVETASVILLKEICDQPRPAMLLQDVRLVIPLYRNAFPSGDVALAFVIAGVLARGERLWIQIILFQYAAFVAYERVYLGVHFPLDVAAGALIGTASALLAPRILQRMRHRRPSDMPQGELCG